MKRMTALRSASAGLAGLVWLTCLTCLAGGAGVAFADPGFPWLYDVIGVADGDVLHLRADPSSDGDVIGSLPGDATGVEAISISDNGYWLQVALPETMGWAAAGYLAPRAHDPDLLFTERLTCAGTEPFWGLDITQGSGAVFTRMDKPDADIPAGRIRAASDAPDRYFLDLGKHHAAMIEARTCTDGMSDRVRGLNIRLVIDRSRTMMGCCSLLP